MGREVRRQQELLRGSNRGEILLGDRSRDNQRYVEWLEADWYWSAIRLDFTSSRTCGDKWVNDNSIKFTKINKTGSCLHKWSLEKFQFFNIDCLFYLFPHNSSLLYHVQYIHWHCSTLQICLPKQDYTPPQSEMQACRLTPALNLSNLIRRL